MSGGKLLRNRLICYRALFPAGGFNFLILEGAALLLLLFTGVGDLVVFVVLCRPSISNFPPLLPALYFYSGLPSTLSGVGLVFISFSVLGN